MTTAWKFLDERSMGVFSRFAWPLPVDGSPGPWVDAPDALTCATGVHACRMDDLSWWMSAQLWEIELDGRVFDDDRKIVATRGRLVRRLHEWEAVGDELAEWAAWQVRDHVVALLTDAGDDRAAELTAASSLADLAVTAAAMSSGLDTPVDVGIAQIVDVLDDVPNPILACHDAARAAGHRASANDRSAATFHAAFAAERRQQSRWIGGRLQLA